MKIFEKISRIVLFPTELALRAMVVQQEREEKKVVSKAEKIIESLKNEINNDPEIQGFLKYYNEKFKGVL